VSARAARVRLRRPVAAARAALAAGALCAVILLSGCQDLFNSLFDNGAPTGVTASDGDYADSISVSWGEPDLKSEKWNGATVSYYEIDWSGAVSGSNTTSGTSYSISTAGNQGQYVTVQVTTHLSSGISGAPASDTGFALDTQDLLWLDGGKSYSFTGNQWYVTMLQKGFTYTFDFASPGGSVEFCPYKSLDNIHTMGPGPSSSLQWTCDDSGNLHKFYVHVIGPAPSFTATYSY
jgi:hypothetical protein